MHMSRMTRRSKALVEIELGLTFRRSAGLRRIVAETRGFF
jgi:hypothetical protein